jgi:hypothetical protein
MMKTLTPTSTAAPTTAYAGTRAVRLAPLTCPYCQHGLRAVDVEPLGDDEVRLFCPGCHTGIISIEWQ